MALDSRAYRDIWGSFATGVTVITTDVLGWMASSGGNWLAFLREEVLTPRLSLIEIVKNLVFQGTFLLGLAVCTMLLAIQLMTSVVTTVDSSTITRKKGQIVSQRGRLIRRS